MPVVTVEWYHGIALYINFVSFLEAWNWCQTFTHSKCISYEQCDILAGFDERDRVLACYKNKVYKVSITKGDEKPYRLSYTWWTCMTPHQALAINHVKAKEMQVQWRKDLEQLYVDDFIQNSYLYI